MGGSYTPGNRSLVMPLNSGISNYRNLARFMSVMARSIRMGYGWFGCLRLRFPAAVRTDLTALIP